MALFLGFLFSYPMVHKFAYIFEKVWLSPGLAAHTWNRLAVRRACFLVVSYSLSPLLVSGTDSQEKAGVWLSSQWPALGADLQGGLASWSLFLFPLHFLIIFS